MLYEFDWDPHKEHINIGKHGLTFRKAATIFHDPNHLSKFDELHSEKEDRWITLGIDDTGVLIVIVHTYEPVDENLWRIRIISARKANKQEIQLYNQMMT